MVLFKNADITIYNKYYNKEKSCDMYQRTVIRGVNWQGKRNVKIGSNLSDSGMKTDDTVLVLVDKLDNYISPKRFVRLSDEERIKYFTFVPGDKIVNGDCEFIYTGTKGGQLKDLESSYDDVLNILGVMEWSGHWEIEGK